MRLVYLRGTYVMFSLFSNVMVDLKKLFIKDLRCCDLLAD
jgi:hypothetical protein